MRTTRQPSTTRAPGTVVLERLAGAVGGEAVALDDEALLGPAGVELAVIALAIDPRSRETMGIEDREEQALEVASRPRLAVLSVVGQDSSDRVGPSSSRIPREEGIEGDRTREPPVLGVLERVLELVRRDDGGEVEERARRGGHRDALLVRDLVGRQCDAMD